MESLSTTKIIKKLSLKKIPLFSLNELGGIFDGNRQSLYKRIQRLTKNEILKKLIKGKYLFALKYIDDFTIANFLYQPSYISMQSALSFYNIMTGFSYQITSISVKKTKKITINEKDFVYSRISSDFYWGFEKKEDFLIARPEKALLDYIYFASKGLESLDWDEIDIKTLDKSLLFEWSLKYNKSVIKEIREHIKI